MSKTFQGLKIDRKALNRVAVRGIEKAAATGSLEITCQTCGKRFTLRGPQTSCPRCGTSYRTQ